jgi:hypothetical protein
MLMHTSSLLVGKGAVLDVEAPAFITNKARTSGEEALALAQPLSIFVKSIT